MDEFQRIPRKGFICGLPILMNYALMERSTRTKTSRQYHEPFSQNNNEARVFTDPEQS
jgi:hypothetical protein